MRKGRLRGTIYYIQGTGIGLAEVLKWERSLCMRHSELAESFAHGEVRDMNKGEAIKDL